MRIGVVQPVLQTGDEAAVASHRVTVTAMARRCFESGAQLVVLPECAQHPYFPDSQETVSSWAEPLSGPSVQRWSALAGEFGGYLVAGMLERSGADVFNSAVLVGPRGLVGCYRKVHRFGWERAWVAAGDCLPVFMLPEWDVRLGILICYDLRFPEAVRSLALAGADILAVPTTWTSIGKSVLWDEAGYCPQNHLAMAHAYMNRMAVVCADRAGQEGSVTFLGNSLVVDATGTVALGPLPGRDGAIGTVDLDPHQSRNKLVGDAAHLFNDRREECYRLRLDEEAPHD